MLNISCFVPALFFQTGKETKFGGKITVQCSSEVNTKKTTFGLGLRNRATEGLFI